MIRKFIGALLITATLITANTALAQSLDSTTTITSEGTLSEYGPQGIIIKTEVGTEPVRYISNETTNYVDQNGNPVSATSMRSGLPVTVYYTKAGNTLIASRIMVRNGLVTSPQAVQAAQTATMSTGIISEFGPGQMIIKTESSPDPLIYNYSNTTTYVDENGAPVSIKMVKSGLPVIVFYSKVGGTLVANKVIVRKAVVVPNPVIETKKTTTTSTRSN